MDKPKPDDRSDNVEKIQYNINHTIHNMEAANETAERSDSEITKRQVREKNERREMALDGMRKEIRDEAIDREKRNK